MRPLRLVVSAIGPFASATEVRFDELADDGLFLIHGPTGSGKTFLLDALTFALYGAVGSDRAVTGLRSDHAERGVDSFVELEFLAQGARWKVHRTPQHERAKKRGSGTTTEQSHVVLFRWSVDGWEAVAQRSTEVADQVRDLVGLTHRQFTQVILLPQGRFEAVLRADSAEREGLLKSLFDTELYERVGDHLEQQARRAEAECVASDAELERLRRQAWDRWTEIRGLAGLDDLSALDDADGGAPDELARRPLIEDVPVDQVQLDLLADEASSATKVATRHAADAADRLSTARDAHQAVASLAERFDRRAELLATSARLASTAEQVDEARQRLALAADAAALAPALRDGQAAQQQLADATSRADTHARRAARALGAVPRPSAAVTGLDLTAAGAPDDLDPARAAVSAAVAQLTELVQVDRRRLELDDQSRLAEVEARDAGRDAARHREAAASAAERIEPARAQLEQAGASLATLPGLRAAAAEAARRLDAVRRLGAARRQLDQAVDAHETARATANLAHERWNDARAVYLDGVAAVLAAQLEPGCSCPVCGSDEHPHLATPVQGAVTLDQVETAEQVAALADATRDEAAEARVLAEREVDRLVERAGDVATDVDAAVQACELAAQQVQSADAAAATEPAARAALDAATAGRDDATEQAERAELRAATARTRAETLRVEAARCERRLAEQLGDDVSLDDALAAWRTLGDSLGTLAQARTAVVVAHAAAATAARRLADELDASSFDSVAHVADASLDERTVGQLTEQVERHDRLTSQVTLQLQAPELAELPDERPDPAPTAACLDAATRQDAVARRRVVRLGDGADQIVSWSDEHRAVLAQSAQVRRHAARLRRLSDTAGGRTGTKLSLQRWVLATYLDEICTLATLRLRTMTAGRYSLHVHRAQVRGNARSGLDLRVLDAFTGEQRDVSSLSGGETFQASLALALAVADAVEQHTGGVRLDALFVDEGFGTLDPDALELAMDELDQLRAGGRMVGVISHVGGLKERVRTGIELTPSSRGSTVRVGQITAA